MSAYRIPTLVAAWLFLSVPGRLVAAEWTVVQQDRGFEAVREGEHLALEVRDQDIVRIRRSLRPAWSQAASVAVLPATSQVKPTIVEKAGVVTLATPAMSVRFATADGSLTVVDANGRVVLREAGHALATGTCGRNQDEPIQKVDQSWTLAAGESLYGMGDVLADGLDLRPRLARKPLLIKVDNIIDPMPCWVSTAGYGVLWDCPAPATAAVKDDQLMLSTQLADEEDYYVVVAPRLADAVRGFHRLTGKAPLPPRWAFGYVQSKERYKNQNEIVAVAQRLRKDHFPCDAVVQDWQYWGKFGWNAMRFDPAVFPDPAQMVQDLHAMNVHLLLSVWSNFPAKSPMWEALKQGLLLDDKEVWGKAFLYDTWSPEARRIVWQQARTSLLSVGVDGWWTDHTDFMGYQDGNATTARGNVQRVFNSFVMGACQPYYEGQRQAAPEKRVMTLTRSVYPGVQRYGAFYWSGDVAATWEVLRQHQAAALNTCLSGIPYWNSDIGGFFINGKAFPDANKNPAYRELYVRWFQFATFTALMRSHGTNAPREPWQFGKAGEPVYDALVKFVNLRYRLLPYLYSQAWAVTDESQTLMRALPMEFPDEPGLRDLAGQWLFGPSLMVSPVTAAQKDAAQRTVVFPQACYWFDFWSGERIAGGSKRTYATADLSTMPLHVRAGSIIPFGPELQHTGEKVPDPLEIRVYPGADARFTLYEDTGDGYGYERGERSTIAFTWDDDKQTLRIAARDGRFPGMLEKRTFRVVRVHDGIGGAAPSAAAGIEVAYSGTALEIPCGR